MVTRDVAFAVVDSEQMLWVGGVGVLGV